MSKEDKGKTSFGIPGAGYGLLSKHAEVLHASLNPHIFSSAHGIVTMNVPPGTTDVFYSMIVTDDPWHKRLRS